MFWCGFHPTRRRPTSFQGRAANHPSRHQGKEVHADGSELHHHRYIHHQLSQDSQDYVKRPVKPEDLLTPWHRHPRGSDRRHFSLLHHWTGGYYPVEGQLEECAKPFFALERELDGTAGYKMANDYRMARLLRGLYTSPKLVWRIARSLVCHPLVTSTMIECFFIEKSWDGQFRGEDSPMKALRHTWRRIRHRREMRPGYDSTGRR